MPRIWSATSARTSGDRRPAGSIEATVAWCSDWTAVKNPVIRERTSLARIHSPWSIFRRCVSIWSRLISRSSEMDIPSAPSGTVTPASSARRRIFAALVSISLRQRLMR